MFLANNLETRRFAKRIDYRIPQNATLIHFFITFIKYHNNNFKKLIAATCIMKHCTRPQYKCTLTRRMSQSQFVVRLVGRVSGWVLRPRLTPKVRSHRFFFRPQTGARSFTWLSLLILSSSRGSGSSLDGRAVFQTGFLFNRLCLT